ncbi:hypothetical protein H6P81_009863 [Aristolochia fimbriata]|uniref:Protein FAR1-RELATED SEQUENCE n=1 Tax=Aristolochia fimbriata TaxID=158543 RepID=A0AAV7ERK6_ARIFI|nr:hypothetical protein H6P81_009863 [Aristolochia fimbriata]
MGGANSSPILKGPDLLFPGSQSVTSSRVWARLDPPLDGGNGSPSVNSQSSILLSIGRLNETKNNGCARRNLAVVGGTVFHDRCISINFYIHYALCFHDASKIGFFSYISVTVKLSISVVETFCSSSNQMGMGDQDAECADSPPPIERAKKHFIGVGKGQEERQIREKNVKHAWLLRVYEVDINSSSHSYGPSFDNFTCTCCMFEYKGIPCSHMIKVHIAEGFDYVKLQYILERWTLNARLGEVKDVRGKGRRYAKLCHDLVEISTIAAESEEAFLIACDLCNKMRCKVMEVLKKQHVGVFTTHDASTNEAHLNPDAIHVRGIAQKGRGRRRGRGKVRIRGALERVVRSKRGRGASFTSSHSQDDVIHNLFSANMFHEYNTQGLLTVLVIVAIWSSNSLKRPVMDTNAHFIGMFL